VKAGLETPGFSFVEAMTQCPTNFGRRNKFKQVADQIEFLKGHSLLKSKRDRMIEQGEKIPDEMYVIGELARRSRPAMGLFTGEAKP